MDIRKQVFLVAHSKIPGADEVCMGRKSMELGKVIKRDAQKVRKRIGDVETVFSSPVGHCVALAEELGKGLIKVDEGLNELDFGRWEGQRWKELEADPLFGTWCAHYDKTACPYGESYEQLFKRVELFWNTKIEPIPSGSMVIVTHGSVIRAVVAVILGLSLKSAGNIDIKPASVSQIWWSERLRRIGYLNMC